MAEIPRTRAGKERKVAKTMGEFKSGDLKSSSGDKVTNPKQAVAIALSQTGQSKPAKPAGQARNNSGQARNDRLAAAVSQRIDRGHGR